MAKTQFFLTVTDYINLNEAKSIVFNEQSITVRVKILQNVDNKNDFSFIFKNCILDKFAFITFKILKKNDFTNSSK